MKEELFFLSFCDPKYIKGFGTIWARYSQNPASISDIVDNIPDYHLVNLRRQIDNALEWVSRHKTD